MIFLLVVLLASSAKAQLGIVGDLNCTAFNGTLFVYSPSAVACSNTLSDAYCSVAYPAHPSFGYPAEGSAFARPIRCYSLAAAAPGAVNPDAKTAAIAHCAKFCGLCCQTTAYSCKNIQFPRISCSTVTRAMCQAPLWRQILAEDCPNVCGFCDLNGCIDAVIGCDNDLSICNAIGMQEFVNQNCRRTCGRCSMPTAKPCNG